jgi:hypothetical protein
MKKLLEVTSALLILAGSTAFGGPVYCTRDYTTTSGISCNSCGLTVGARHYDYVTYYKCTDGNRWSNYSSLTLSCGTCNTLIG